MILNVKKNIKINKRQKKRKDQVSMIFLTNLIEIRLEVFYDRNSFDNSKFIVCKRILRK